MLAKIYWLQYDNAKTGSFILTSVDMSGNAEYLFMGDIEVELNIPHPTETEIAEMKAKILAAKKKRLTDELASLQ